MPVWEAAPTVPRTEDFVAAPSSVPWTVSAASQTGIFNDRNSNAVPVSDAVPHPIAPFRAFVSAGEMLAALHVGYETAAEYPLNPIVNKEVPFSWRVTKMRLNKDKTAVIVSEALTLSGIPAEASDYKLGSHSALEWVIDQYQVSTDTRSGIVSDLNRADDPEYIVRLVRRVVTVSVETAKIVASLPPLALLP